MNLVDIIDGTVKNALNINDELSKSRLRICYLCPLYSTKNGGSCNNNLWLDPVTGDTSNVYKQGYKRGCGCILNSKTRIPHAVCPVNKW